MNYVPFPPASQLAIRIAPLRAQPLLHYSILCVPPKFRFEFRRLRNKNCKTKYDRECAAHQWACDDFRSGQALLLLSALIVFLVFACVVDCILRNVCICIDTVTKTQWSQCCLDNAPYSWKEMEQLSGVIIQSQIVNSEKPPDLNFELSCDAVSNSMSLKTLQNNCFVIPTHTIVERVHYTLCLYMVIVF